MRAFPRRFLAGCFLCLCWRPDSRIAAQAQQPSTERETAHLNNLGVAYMNQNMVEEALTYFREAIATNDSAATPHLNVGIALLNSQQLDGARAELERAAALNPKDPHIWYNLGLVRKSQDNAEEEVRAFTTVLQLTPDNADAHYFLGTVYNEQKDYARAAAEFREALHLSPLHASSEYGLARALQRSGKTDEARQHFERFQKITSQKLASPLSQSYGEQGAYSLAEEMKSNPASAGAMIPVIFREQQFSGGPAHSGALCLIDLDGHGKTGILTTSDDGVVLFRGDSRGSYSATAGESIGLKVVGRGTACAVGDLDNDGKPDVVIATQDTVLVFRNAGNGFFVDMTAQSKITPRNHPSGLTLVDYDHDGDLDLLVTGAPLDGQKASTPNVLWRNNGNMTFTESTESTGLGGHESTSASILSDVNNDRAVDLAVASGKDGVLLYLNQREGKFLSMPLYKPGELPPAVGVTVLDYNKDGWMDVAVTHNGVPSLTLWRNIEGKRFQRVPLPTLDLMQGLGVVPIDFDNDGWIDLAVVGKSVSGAEVNLLRNLGNGKFADISSQTGLNKIGLAAAQTIVAADVDGDGAPDLLVAGQSNRVMLLHNDGGNRHHSVRIVLSGLADNKSAIGTKVELFAGGQWQKWEIASSSGLTSQGINGVLAGLGESDQVDIVRLLWPTGVPQDEIHPNATGSLEITELDRRGGSCPVLFAWNGSKYEFVSDAIGAAVVGHWISPTAHNIADPDEWIKVSGPQLQPYRGYLSLRIGEPMEEVNFLDQVRLRAIDHPADTDVFPNERFQNYPPFADGKTILVRLGRHVQQAWDSNGNDVTNLLRERDHQYVHDFTNLSYGGFANLHSLTLDLGEWSAQNPLRLLMVGFIEYFSASSMYAADQAGLRPVAPYVETQLPNGEWKKIIEDMGFPAGLPRVIVVDLTGKLPSGARRIRITTNLQIYWDQVMIANDDEAHEEIRETELSLHAATLAFRGYPRQIDGKTAGDLTYHYDEASLTGPFFRQSGAYTRYGDVTSLLTSIDDQFTIFGTGEDVDLEFETLSLPPLRSGWKRDYFFYGNGFVKDMDYYEALPFTVSQLPFHAMTGYPYGTSTHYPDTPQLMEYQLQWNSRMESGIHHGTYHFDYQPRNAMPEVR
jgi:Flp pilus assembly protein TadD